MFGPGAPFTGVGTIQLSDSPPALAFHYPGITVDSLSVGKEDTGHNTFRFRAGNPGADGPAGIDVEGNSFLRGFTGIKTMFPVGALTIGSPAIDGQGQPSQGLVFVDSAYPPSQWGQAAIYSDGSAGFNGSLVFATDGNSTPDYALEERMRIAHNGNVGIGTANPGARLEINGNFKFTAGSAASMTFPDSTVQATAWNGVLTGGDYAESVDVSGDRDAYEPGDVMVIDPDVEGRFVKSAAPYSTGVTGIYSTKPGVVGRRQQTARDHMKDEVPMAMTGIVPTKVSAENGEIKPGDLLVSSSKTGYAMKGTDRSRMLGAVIGKAIGHLSSGTGVIEAVVTLQ